VCALAVFPYFSVSIKINVFPYLGKLWSRATRKFSVSKLFSKNFKEAFLCFKIFLGKALCPMDMLPRQETGQRNFQRLYATREALNTSSPNPSFPFQNSLPLPHLKRHWRSTPTRLCNTSTRLCNTSIRLCNTHYLPFRNESAAFFSGSQPLKLLMRDRECVTWLRGA